MRISILTGLLALFAFPALSEPVYLKLGYADYTLFGEVKRLEKASLAHRTNRLAAGLAVAEAANDGDSTSNGTSDEYKRNVDAPNGAPYFALGWRLNDGLAFEATYHDIGTTRLTDTLSASYDRIDADGEAVEDENGDTIIDHSFTDPTYTTQLTLEALEVSAVWSFYADGPGSDVLTLRLGWFEPDAEIVTDHAAADAVRRAFNDYGDGGAVAGIGFNVAVSDAVTASFEFNRYGDHLNGFGAGLSYQF